MFRLLARWGPSPVGPTAWHRATGTRTAAANCDSAATAWLINMLDNGTVLSLTQLCHSLAPGRPAGRFP